ALRAPGLRETFRVATRASYYRDAFAAAHVDVARARRPEDLGDFYLTPEVLKTRPEALLAGTPELAIESSGTSGRVTRVYLSRRELEYNARQGGLLYGLYGLGRGDRLLSTLDLGWGLGSLLVERGGDDPRLRVHPSRRLSRERVRLLRGDRRSGRRGVRRGRPDDGQPARDAADPLSHRRRGAVDPRALPLRAPVPPALAAPRAA